MKRIFLYITLMLFLCAMPASAFQLVAARPVAACTSQSQDANYDAGNSYTIYTYNGACLGQSFTTTAFGSDTELYSVKFEMYASGNDCDVTVILGTTENVATSQIGGETAATTVSGGSWTWYEFIFPSGNRPTVSQSTVYYTCFIGDCIYDNSVIVARNNNDASYGGGTGWRAPISSDCDDLADQAYDLGFDTYICD